MERKFSESEKNWVFELSSRGHVNAHHNSVSLCLNNRIIYDDADSRPILRINKGLEIHKGWVIRTIVQSGKNVFINFEKQP